jgi:hypothetical protein
MAMESSIECTHCGVVMTSWAAPGSPIRYYQCPFCSRTHSSLYGEVFRRRAGARIVEAPRGPAAPSAVPMASAEDVHWALIKSTAARWFARLEADEQRNSGPRVPRALARPRRAVDDVPEIDAADVVEIAPAAAGRKR